jgi:hypothetical protein
MSSLHMGSNAEREFPHWNLSPSLNYRKEYLSSWSFTLAIPMEHANMVSWLLTAHISESNWNQI